MGRPSHTKAKLHQQKPYHPKSLVKAVRECLDRSFPDVGNPALAGLTRVRHAVEPTTQFAGLKGTTGSSTEECLIDNLIEQSALPRGKLLCSSVGPACANPSYYMENSNQISVADAKVSSVRRDKFTRRGFLGIGSAALAAAGIVPAMAADRSRSDPGPGNPTLDG